MTRPRALHGVLVHAHDTIKNAREYETYVTITAQLTAVGSEAWGMIKTQERDLQMQQWDFTLQALALDRQRWYNTAVDIFGRGTDQWAGMDAQFNSAWNGWLSTTKDKLETERQKWIAAADNLVKGRDSWLADVSAAASRGAADTLALAGLDKIEASINGVLGSLPGAFTTPDFDADKLAADILRDNRVAMLPVDFMKLMDSANINFSITELSRMGTAGATTGFDRMLQDFEKAGTVMENMRLFDSLDRTIDSYKKMLAEADKQTAKGVADSLLKEGFKQSGADWTRRAIVDATIWGAQWDTQVVPGYEFYTPPEFQYNIKADGATFTPDKLAAMSTAEVQALATAARINLKKQFDSLMGDNAEDPQNKQSLQYHIGKVPSVDDGKVKWSTGLGQMKDVIGTMIDKNIQKARGEAKANGPFWSKPLWDSDKDNDGSNDGFFGAPNIMTIAKIAVSVAGGGPWLSFALDAFDTAYNVAAGNMSLKDGAIGLAKGAAVATVSSLGVSSFIGNTVGTATAGLGSVVSSTLSAVAQNYSSSLINGAINAFSGDGWSFDSFKQSAKDGLKGAAIAGTTALVGGLINSANGQTFGKYKNPNGKEGFGWHTSQSGVLDNMSSSISSIGNYWGGLAGQAMSFAMGDGFSLNMLNSADFGVGNSGLLELRIGGKQKNLFSFALGSGGADVSRSIMNQMDAGYRQLDFMKKVKSSESLSGLETQAQLAKINMMRWAGGKAAQMAELEVGGMIRSFYNAGDYNSSRGMMTTLGLDDIEVDEKGNITLASQARLAVRQTHESTHVLQNIASYNSGVSMTAMDRELDAHGAGIAAWQGLLDTFGSGLASTSRGSANDQAFASEMSSLSLGMANGQLERHLGANYSMSGEDWARLKFQSASQTIKPGTFFQKDTLYQSQVSFQQGDTMKGKNGLYASLGLNEKGEGPEADMVRKALIQQIKEKFPLGAGIPDSLNDDDLDKFLQTIDPGQLTISLNFAQSYGGYFAGADLDLDRGKQWYEKGIGVLAWPAVQAAKGVAAGASWAYDQVFGGVNDRGQELVDSWITHVHGKPYDTSGYSHTSNRDGTKWDCSSGPYFMLKEEMGYSSLPENMNAKMMLQQLPLIEIAKKDLKSGDLVFYDYANSRNAWNHVAVYMNPNQDGYDMLNSTEYSGNHYARLSQFNSWASSAIDGGQPNPYAPANIVYRRIDWKRMERYRGRH